MNVNFKSTLLADHRQCVALLQRVRAQSAAMPARWLAAKKSGDQARMDRVLRETEALAALEKVLKAAEIRMRTAVLSRAQSVNRIVSDETRKKEAQAGTSFSKRLPLVHRRHTLETERKEINRQTVKMGMDYLELCFKELLAAG